MGATTLISLAEYLDTSYRPDCEYIDGEVRERNVGKWEHARLQWLLAQWFGNHEREWQITGSTEQRMLVSGRRVRIPDVVVMRKGPQPDVLTEPPLLVVEILSPEDRYTDTEERARDYLEMGVDTVWIIDPRTRTGRACVGAAWVASERLGVAGTAIYVELGEMFSRIDGDAVGE